MSKLAPDVEVAVELITHLDLSRWLALGRGFVHPTPYIQASDAVRLEELLAWTASHSLDQPSFVQAAVANVARVLTDLTLVLNYKMEPRAGRDWVSQWYRPHNGQVGSQRELEEWSTHVALIHNLGVELNRAINLVIKRVQRADESALVNMGSAVIETGPTYAPMEALAYSSDEAEVPQPYPGLEQFPRVLDDRRGSGLGVHTDKRPMTIKELERWTAHLIEKCGPGSGPPLPGIPPLSLPRPQSDPPMGNGRETRGVPTPLGIAYSVLLIFATVSGVLTRPWLAGAAIGAACATALLHRRVWRWPPERIPAIVVIAVAVVGGGIGEFIAHAGHGTSRLGPPSTVGRGSTTTSQSTTQPSPPELNADVTCATVRDASGGQVHRAIFVDSPGQLEAGGRAMLGKVLPHGQYTDLLRVTEGAELEFSVKLWNTEYGAVQGAVVATAATPGGDGCWTLTTRVHSQTEGPGHLTLGRVFVLLESNSAGRLQYVPGSTELFDVNDKVIAHLPDGMTRQGVSIPYEIQPAPAGLYYVNWKMRVR
jgi:hypothetical protein